QPTPLLGVAELAGDVAEDAVAVGEVLRVLQLREGALGALRVLAGLVDAADVAKRLGAPAILDRAGASVDLAPEQIEIREGGEGLPGAVPARLQVVEQELRGLLRVLGVEQVEDPLTHDAARAREGVAQQGVGRRAIDAALVLAPAQLSEQVL